VLCWTSHARRADSLDAIPRVSEASPGTACVVLTMQEDPRSPRRCAPAPSGYVLKEAADDELVEAVRRAAVGDHISIRSSAAALAWRRRAERPAPTTSPSASSRSCV
jgi:DNA-binding NarL/FixJ family response regulator